jgi:hypothetical protein
MSDNQIYVPGDVLRALHETAELCGGLELHAVMGAAVWNFARQDAAAQHQLLSEYLLQPPWKVLRTGKQPTISEQLHDLVCRLCAAVRQLAPW